ncbi:MAG: type VI secretion system ATPase TssH, partial [Candidatus Ornithospirochaeta sp.]
EIRRVVHLQLQSLADRLEKKNITVSWTPDVEDYVAQAGFDPSFGARPIRRCIQNEIENSLSRAILSGSVPRDGKINVGVQDSKITVSLQ